MEEPRVTEDRTALNAFAAEAEKGVLMRPFENKSVVDRIIDRLTKAIIAKELLPGQKIPTEAELCESMRVGRNSVREAIKVMVAMGVLVIRRSEGTFVTEGFSERMLDPMVYGLILEGGDSSAVIELRKLFDTGVLQLAIQKRTDEEVAELTRCLDRMAEMVKRRPGEEEMLREDVAFHRLIGSMAKNPLADKISVVIERLTLPSRTDAVRSFIEKGEYDGFIRKHADLVRVIAERDDAAVGRVIDDHYSHWKVVSVRLKKNNQTTERNQP